LRFQVVNGLVRLINRFALASQRQVMAEELGQAQAEVVVAGHAGVPIIVRTGSGVWFKLGVVGMPAIHTGIATRRCRRRNATPRPR
jgi:hypothetical protein